MIRTANVVLLLACAASLAAIVLSVYPGVLRQLMLIPMLTSIIWLPIAVGVAVSWTVRAIRRGTPVPVKEWPWIRYGLAAGILVSTLVVVRYYVPRRIAFMASVDAFESRLVEAPVQQHGGVPLNKRLGVFMVQDYAADERGGVYFRVHRGLFGVDTVSYGFVHAPNGDGSPYGAADYRLYRLGSGWYWFIASNDWY